MFRITRFGVGIVSSVGLVVAYMAGCEAAEPGEAVFTRRARDAGAAVDDDPILRGDLGSFSDSGERHRACAGLECQQIACTSGGDTTLTGKVFDPSGTVPLYNAVVYVPNAELAPLTSGATCDRCGTTPSGSPVTTALTDATGSFTLKNVPVGTNIPLVIQIGKWRRKVQIPSVPSCVATALDPSLTRLPRSKAEGAIPKIAVTTGDADSLECFLRRIGIADSEFTNPSGDGRVNLYQGQKDGGKGAKLDGQTPTANSLWDEEAKLKSYDMVILSCEGAEDDANKSDAARANVRRYLEAGGRVFASHYHYTWFARNAGGQVGATENALWPTAGSGWVNASTQTGNRTVDIDQTFPKGQAFADWMVAVGGSPVAKGKLAAEDLKKSLTTVDPTHARRWIYDSSEADATKFMSFNAPLGKAADDQCGRGVFTDIHVTGDPPSDQTFPAHCQSGALLPQEKALLFMLFDLASCIQDESKPPQPPPVVPR